METEINTLIFVFENFKQLSTANLTFDEVCIQLIAYLLIDNILEKHQHNNKQSIPGLRVLIMLLIEKV